MTDTAPESFQKVPLFDDLEPLEIVKLLRTTQDLEAKPGDRIVEEGLSVRAAEDLARGKPKEARPRKEPAKRDPNLDLVCDALREHLQTRVRITGDGTRGSCSSTS